ncbi:CIA30 family protein [Rhodobaculum claviforme]|uniref:CIA30 family protein n=1 Tax=Rhodobaculum claviforme TaxID=1549854 RepID=A0A934TKL3_9RHOB|nr:CIA30 family protein [Rhodobaculum claviforme]MBK5927844.1 CIA30 family protein [Rhodobaculum claviforme]
MSDAAILDDLSRPHPESTLGTRWALVTDGVMGGVSQGLLRRADVAGRPALRMTGTVRTENNGGFVQMALDLAPGGGTLDARGWAGLELDLLGNGVEYGVHLRTDTIARPWQSWRQPVTPARRWSTLRLAFGDFAPHRIDAPLDRLRLRRIGLVAIGRPFEADLALGGLRLWR